MTELYPITQDGLIKIQHDLNECMQERPKIIEAIATARDFGDLSENAEYHAARERQSFLEGQIQELQSRIATARVIDISSISTDRVVFGSVVTVVDINTDEEFTYQILSDVESAPAQNKISMQCPLGKALIGKKVDDIVEFEPAGQLKEFEIINISEPKS